MPDKKILIIDDEVDVGIFFKRLLQKKGYQLTVAVNGVEATKALKETTFNVAMVDLKLPDTDGLTLLQQIKSVQPAYHIWHFRGHAERRYCYRCSFGYVCNTVSTQVCNKLSVKLFAYRNFDIVNV